jgi:hypothetical protein
MPSIPRLHANLVARCRDQLQVGRHRFEHILRKPRWIGKLRGGGFGVAPGCFDLTANRASTGQSPNRPTHPGARVRVTKRSPGYSRQPCEGKYSILFHALAYVIQTVAFRRDSACDIAGTKVWRAIRWTRKY